MANPEHSAAEFWGQWLWNALHTRVPDLIRLRGFAGGVLTRRLDRFEFEFEGRRLRVTVTDEGPADGRA